MRAPKICSYVGPDGPCPNLQPCPTHERRPWEGSTRRERTISGSRQQARARAVMSMHQGICHVCARPGSDQVDHVIPLAEGGADTMENLRPIHAQPCHRDKTAAEARRARGVT